LTRRLLIRPGAIGDCIVSLPALEFLKADYTEVWTAGQNVPLIRFADRVRSVMDTGIDAFPPRLQALAGFDDIVSWYGTKRPEFREATAGYPIRFLDALPNEPNLHATDFYLRQVGAPAGGVPCIPCPRSDGGFVAVHPYSGSAAKNWVRFDEFATLPPLPVRSCVDLFEDLYELACWLASASVYVGNDSGITHLAAAVGVPTVAIFQASDPAVWAPRGRAQVRVLHSPSVDEVVATVRSLLPPG
jgi:hypothetical protein